MRVRKTSLPNVQHCVNLDGIGQSWTILREPREDVLRLLCQSKELAELQYEQRTFFIVALQANGAAKKDRLTWCQTTKRSRHLRMQIFLRRINEIKLEIMHEIVDV